jgi:SAM-dependent methyltransferase
VSLRASHGAGPDQGAEHDQGGAWHYTREFWDERYSSAGQLWSGKPNHQLVAQVSHLPPGEALDAGCGEGADAIWLAERGWAVTAVDVSLVALERGARHAAAAGAQVARRISWRTEDLLTWTPPAASFDLVSAQFMHLPPEAFQAMYRRLATAVRHGGTLLVVMHHADDLHANVGRIGHPGAFPAAHELAAALDPAAWQVIEAAGLERPATDLDGQPVTVKDTVLRAVRRG